MITRQIGIDFGTSTTVISIKDYENGQEIREQPPEHFMYEGRPQIPTVIFETEDGEFLFGEQAESFSGKGTLHLNFKMDLLSEELAVAEKAKELVLAFFHHLRNTYLEQRPFNGDYDVETTCISYPAKWPEEIRQFMLRTAQEAGFEQVSGMDEPTAAVNACLYQYYDRFLDDNMILEKRPYKILMIDMGAGTTDLVVCEYTPGGNSSVQILLTWPDQFGSVFFGGREIDAILTDYCVNYLERYGMNYQKKKGQISRYVKRWKENELSKSLSGNKKLQGKPIFLNTMINSDHEFEFGIYDRPSFEATSGTYLDKFAHLVFGCAQKLKIDLGQSLFSETDFIILTGGNSQWYFVEDYLLGRKATDGVALHFAKIAEHEGRILHMTRPQETVAFGLALNQRVLEQRFLKHIASRGTAQPAESGRKKKILKTEKSTRPQKIKQEKIPLFYPKTKDLQACITILNEASLALGDSTRELKDSSLKMVLKSASTCASVGAIASTVALYGLGTAGLGAAGVTSALAAAGAMVGGTALAGAAVLAAPVVVLGAGGAALTAGIVNAKQKKERVQRKKDLLKLAGEQIALLKERGAIESSSNAERQELIRGLIQLLEQMTKELESDLLQEG